MISEPGNEKAAMARGISIPMTRPMMMADEPQIKQTRKILMIILGVCVALSVIGEIFAHINAQKEDGTQMVQSLLLILLHSVGLFVAHGYHVMGLRVFAWFLVISLVLRGISGVASFVGLIVMLGAIGGGGDTKGIMGGLSVLVFIWIIVWIVAFILTVVIVKLAFRLAKLIENFDPSNNQQI